MLHVIIHLLLNSKIFEKFKIILLRNPDSYNEILGFRKSLTQQIKH